MKARLIRYQTHENLAEENEALIRAVLGELNEERPPGIRYAALRLPDSTFYHLVMLDPALDRLPLLDLTAFQAFQEGIRARAVEPHGPGLPRAALSKASARARSSPL